MFKKKRIPLLITNYLGTFIVKEDSSVYTQGKNIVYGAVNGEEKHLGTLVGFVTEEKFHELYKNGVSVDDLKDGISKEPKLGYTMVIKKPESYHKDLFPNKPLYEVRIVEIKYL